MLFRLIFPVFALLCLSLDALRYDPAYVGHNLNENQTAVHPLDYWGEWANHTYNPSPTNWRFPFYTLFLDRFVNGDPENDNANGTMFEHDPSQTQLRHGGDIMGLMDSLDYLQGMGIRGVYLAGSAFMNLPWQADGMFTDHISPLFKAGLRDQCNSLQHFTQASLLCDPESY